MGMSILLAEQAMTGAWLVLMSLPKTGCFFLFGFLLQCPRGFRKDSETAAMISIATRRQRQMA